MSGEALLAVLVFLWDGAAARRAPGRVISTTSATKKPSSLAKVDSRKSVNHTLFVVHKE